MIIGFSGSIGSGKDTVAEMFMQCFNNKETYKNKTTRLWKHKKFAGKLKQIVAMLTGCKVEDLESETFKNSNLSSEWDIDGKPQTYRHILQKLGTDLLRNGIHQNVHINALFSDYNIISLTDGWIPSYNNPDNNGFEKSAEPIYHDWILTDLRFENEFDAIKERGGICIRIERYMTFNEWTKVLNIPNNFYGDESLYPKIEFLGLLKEVGYKNDAFYAKHLHQSEIGLEKYYVQGKFDYTIENDSTLDDLRAKVEQAIKDLKI